MFDLKFTIYFNLTKLEATNPLPARAKNSTLKLQML